MLFKVIIARLSYEVRECSLFELLLGSELAGVAAALLPAVGGARVHPGVADAADVLLAVVLLRQQPQGRLDHAAAQTQNLAINT